MKTARSAISDEYSPYLLVVIRRISLIVSAVVALYSILAIFGVVATSSIFYPLVATAIAGLFIAIGIIQYVQKKPTKSDIRLHLIIYHILATLFVVWVAGFNTAVVFLWIVLAVIVEVHYAKRGLVLSFGVLLLSSIYSLFSGGDYSSAILIDYLLSIIFIIIVTLAIVQLRSVQKQEQRELRNSRAEEELQRGQLLTLINSLNIAVITTSARGTVRLYNAALLNLLDTNNSLSGKKIEDILHLSDASGEPAKLGDMIHGRSRPFERDDLTLKLGDGEDIRILFSAAPIRGTDSKNSSRIEGHIFILRDITKAKSLEEERDEFISVVSHELRTPITIAEGTISNLQLLLERGQKLEALTPALKEAHEQILYLANMVNDLGTLSRAERGVGDEPEDIDLGELLNELYHKYEPTAKRKGLSFDIERSARLGMVTTSRLYLEEILQNFITNAIKYTQEGGVTLSAKRHGDQVAFAVKDSGIGISKSDLKHIFEKFYRSEDFRTRETSGTGLGLYVTRKLADKLGVKVEVNSRLNHGSTFGFKLINSNKQLD